MTSPIRDRWNRVRELFEAAVELTPEARTSFLDEACAEDTTLRADVDSLLEADDEADDESLVPSAYRDLAAEEVEHLERSTEEDRSGERLGRYRLVRRLGRGGMGSVYLGEQDDEVRRRVAVKILRRGLDTDDVLRRFRSEQQILAGLDHPHIARFLDGGRTEDGLPYFLLEYVEGRPIDEYCRDADLGPSEILRLFLQVCDAVRSAHESLIIHCDLKPANILVTEEGGVKLLDFGIAKVLSSDWQFTRTQILGPRPLTPAYASPEQMVGDAVSTRSDVYSLGVVLVELLGGERPTGAQRVRLQGDLESIARMALAEEPEQRYGSAEQLADDLRRSLDGLPVHARAPTRRYRALRFVQRNRIAVGLGFAFLVSLIAGLVGTTWQAREAALQRDRAVQAAESAEQVVTFLTGMIASASPNNAPQRRLTVEGLLAVGVQRLGEDLRDDPEVAARIAETLGMVYISRAEYREANELFARALSYFRRFPERRADQARVTIQLARSLAGQSHYALGTAMLRDALQMRRALYGDSHPEVADNLSTLSYFLGTLGISQETLELRRESLRIRLEHFEPDHPEALKGKNDLAYALHDVGQCAEAQRLHTEILAVRRAQASDPFDLFAATSMSNLSRVRFDRGEREEGIEQQKKRLEIIREVMPADHVAPGNGLVYLARMYAAKGDFKSAESSYAEALSILEGVLGRRHRSTAWTIVGLGRVALEEGRLEEAESMLREGLDIIIEVFPKDSALEIWAGSAWARARLESGAEDVEATKRLEAAVERYDSLPLTEVSRYDVARDLAAWAALRGEEAEESRWRELVSSPTCSD